MIVGMSKIRLLVLEDCITCPFRRTSSFRLAGSAILFLGHHPGAEWAGADEVLAGGDLLGMKLPFADAAVVENGVAGDMLHRLFLRNVATAFADDHGEFAFPVELIRHLGRTSGSLCPTFARQTRRKIGGNFASSRLRPAASTSLWWSM